MRRCNRTATMKCDAVSLFEKTAKLRAVQEVGALLTGTYIDVRDQDSADYDDEMRRKCVVLRYEVKFDFADRHRIPLFTAHFGEFFDYAAKT